MHRLQPHQRQALEAAARQACACAYAPYSQFPVGAAVLTEEGRIVPGCNVENASLGLSCCAERTALFSAVSQGLGKIVALAIYTPTAGPTLPCGACLQVLREFAADCLVISVCDGEDPLEKFLKTLLPAPFRGQNSPELGA